MSAPTVWDEWLARQKGRHAKGEPPAAVVPDVEEGLVWVHPCGCMTELLPGTPMYPFCAVHSERAVFIGKRGDGYVTTGMKPGADPVGRTDLFPPEHPHNLSPDERRRRFAHRKPR